MAFDFRTVVNGLGAVGKAVLGQTLRGASRDSFCTARCAQEMFVNETGDVWPPANVAERVLWEKRAENAITGLRLLIEGK